MSYAMTNVLTKHRTPYARLIVALLLASGHLLKIHGGPGYYCYVDKAGVTVTCWGNATPKHKPQHIGTDYVISLLAKGEANGTVR